MGRALKRIKTHPFLYYAHVVINLISTLKLRGSILCKDC